MQAIQLSGSSIDRIVAEEKGNHQMAVQTILDDESFLELPLPEGLPMSRPKPVRRRTLWIT